jgi:hypothetical protein
MIHVLIYRVGKPPVLEEIDGNLPTLQAIVGGYIEVVPLFPRHVLVCNEEGKLRGLRHNRFVPVLDDVIVGDFFVGAIADSDFVSIDDAAADVARGMIFGLVRALEVNNV